MSKLTTLDDFISSVAQTQRDKIHQMTEELLSEIDVENIQSERELAEKLGVFDIVN